TAEHDAFSPDRSLNCVIGRQKSRTTMRVNIIDPGVAQPYGPVDRENVMEQRVVSEVGGGAQRIATLEQFRATNRKMIFFHQQFRRKTVILPPTPANCDVNPIADEIGQPLRRGDSHVDISVSPPEPK